jgi:hypothetical protein
MAYQPLADDYRAEAEKVLQRAVGLTPADPKFSALHQAQVATCVRAAGHPRRADQAAGGRQLMILKRMTGPRRAQRPAPDQKLLDAIAQVEQAKADGAARVEKVKADQSVADAQKELAKKQAAAAAECRKVYSEAGCITLKLSEDDKIQFWPIPPGSGLNVTPR